MMSPDTVHNVQLASANAAEGETTNAGQHVSQIPIPES